LRRTWNVLRPTGTFDMNLETLSFRIPRDGKTAWTYDGAATVHDASFDIGFEAKNVDGTLTGKGRLLGGGESISVDAQLDLDRASIDGRELTRVTGRVRRAADYTVLNIDDLTAQLYGGRCAGRAEVDFGEPDTRYGLSVVVRDIALGDFLNAKRKPDQPPVHASGLVNGNLYLAGTAGHHNSRRGKGEIHATRAQLYKLPFLLSILHVINFTIPDENAFHDAVFKFHIGGERLVFDDLRLRGNAMSMVGQGHAHTPTEALDLTLVVGSPHDLPRVPVLTEFIEGAARELMEVRLTGTIKHPNIVAQPLRGVDAALRTLFSTDRLTNP
jgi:hypothetical protein